MSVIPQVIPLRPHKAAEGYFLDGVLEYYYNKRVADEGVDVDAVAEARNRFTIAKADKEEYLAQTTRLEMEKLSGSLVDAEQVKHSVTVAAKNTRKRLLKLPQELSAILVGLDESSIQKEIQQSILSALREIVEIGLEDNSEGDEDINAGSD